MMKHGFPCVTTSSHANSCCKYQHINMDPFRICKNISCLLPNLTKGLLHFCILYEWKLENTF